MHNKRSIPKLIEVIFDSFYLLTVLLLSFYILNNHQNNIRFLWGIMALILFLGDSCHLIPRMLNALSSKEGHYLVAMQHGKLIASVTMTIFYIFLWHCGLIIFDISATFMTIVVYILAIMRILFCFISLNKNISPYLLSLYRNIPFIVQGICVLFIYLLNGNIQNGFNYTWIAILLSFVFYIPVVLLSHKIPVVGMLMIPKSCAYIWIIFMGLNL